MIGRHLKIENHFDDIVKVYRKVKSHSLTLFWVQPHKGVALYLNSALVLNYYYEMTHSNVIEPILKILF